MKFEGIYTPAITPHRPDGEIDRKAFADVLESLIAAGVHGIIIGGSTGEYYAHSPQERFDLAAYAKEVIGSRLPLIVGTGAIRTEELGRLCQGGEGDQGGRHPRHLAALCDPDRAGERGPRADDRSRGRPADHALQLSGSDGRLDGRGVFRPRRPVEECRGDQGELRRNGPMSTCWPGASPTSRSAAAGTTRRWSSSPGVRGAGSAPGRISSRPSISPSTRPAWSRRTSTRAGGS